MPQPETAGDIGGSAVRELGATAELTEIDQALEVVTAVVRRLRQSAGAAPVRARSLSLTELRLLRRVARGVRLTTDLAQDLDVTTATVSAAVDGLVRRGLVGRCAPDSDRRAVPLALSEEGRAVLEEARERQRQAMAEVVSHLAPPERHALAMALSGLSRALAPRTPP